MLGVLLLTFGFVWVLDRTSHIGHLDVLYLLLTLGFVRGLLLTSSLKMLEEDVRSVTKGYASLGPLPHNIKFFRYDI